MAVDASHLHVVLRDAVGLLARAVDAADTSATTGAAAPAPTEPPPEKGGNSQSPLLFFVALGFGVVFTNLWYARSAHIYAHIIYPLNGHEIMRGCYC